MIKPVNREVRTETKIVAMFTIRQFVALIITGIIALVLALTVKLDIKLQVLLFYCPLGFLCLFFGFFTLGGLKGEQILLKYVKCLIYGNQIRKYRTLNRYVSLFHIIDNKNKNKNIDKKEKKKNRKKSPVFNTYLFICIAPFLK